MVEEAENDDTTASRLADTSPKRVGSTTRFKDEECDEEEVGDAFPRKALSCCFETVAKR